MSDPKHGTGAEGWTARLRLHPTAFIAPGAVVVGDVTLGARTSVWFNAVLRGDVDRIEVGEDSNIQDGSVVHMDEASPALIGARVTIGHGAVIHGCVIEDDCLIGMGAVVLSGARIGAGSLIGAGALVREKQTIAPGCIALGIPAEVAGQVSDVHRAGMRRGYEHYVALGRTYLERGFSNPFPQAGSELGLTARQRGPMSFLEWGQLLSVLAESPDWVADRIERDAEALWRKRPAPDRWSALEALCHLRDADRDVFQPRLIPMLAARTAEIPDVAMAGWDTERAYNEQLPAAVLGEWVEARRALLAKLAPLGRADWTRVGVHAARGPYLLGDLVRAWADHDLSHRRQMAEALGEFA